MHHFYDKNNLAGKQLKHYAGHFSALHKVDKQNLLKGYVRNHFSILFFKCKKEHL